jgi:hypothetical protein
MPTARAKIQHEAGARRLASSLALVGGMLFGDPDSAAATPTTTGSALPTSDAPPNSEVAETGGVPRVLVYGAVAGLFLLVAAGLGAHRKH